MNKNLKDVLCEAWQILHGDEGDIAAAMFGVWLLYMLGFLLYFFCAVFIPG